MNNALQDVEELVNLLKKELQNGSSIDFKQIFTEFEPKMSVRAYKMVTKSIRLVDFLHTPQIFDKETFVNFHRIKQHENIKTTIQ